MSLSGEDDVKVFKYRWLILFLFASAACINFIQFLQYSIILNITQKYYDVSSTAIQISSLMYQGIFIVLCFPGNYLMQRYSLRIAMIAGTGLTTIQTILKIIAVSPDRFYLVLLAQFLGATAQVVFLSIPTKLASTWFGPKEVSTASALAVFGVQIGIAIGSVWPANSVKNSDNLDEIGDDLLLIMIINAALAGAIFLAVLILFRAKPKLPPSHSQANLLNNARPNLRKVMMELIKSYNYWLLILSFGLAAGIWTSIGLVINQVYLNYFPGEEETLGILTAASILIGGCIGSVIFGLLLDKFNNYRITSFICLCGSTLTYIFVIITLETETRIGTYFTIPLFGLFMGPVMLVSFEFCTEIMYPLPANVTCAILNSAENVFAILFTLIMGKSFTVVGFMGTFIFTFCMLAASSIAILFVSSELPRREANKKGLQVNNDA